MFSSTLRCGYCMAKKSMSSARMYKHRAVMQSYFRLCIVTFVRNLFTF